MVASYSLAPEPVWFIVNLQGTAAGGAKLYTRSNINPTVNKPAYRDPAGAEAWPNPIIFDLNGTNAPIYWKFDPSFPNDTYYIFVTDAQDNLLWQATNFFPGGSGGGGNTTTYLPLKNYIANNQFIDNTGNTASPIANTNLLLAPSNHQGFTPASLNPIIGTYGAVGPDIRFVTNTAGTPPTDQISFVTFALNAAPMAPTDVTPVQYIRYQCTGAAVGEQFKSFQFPITQKVKNLSNQAMTFAVWAAVTATPVNIQLYSRQYYGSSPSATAESVSTRVAQGAPITLSTTWTQYFINFTMPDVTGNSLGTPGAQTDDDAVYLQLDMPLNSLCDVLFTKPKLYLGTLSQTSEFEDYDEINSINSTPRCGDVRTSLGSSAPSGWVAMNDGSIGNVSSNATTRNNADTFQLFKTIWDGVSNTYAPTQDSTGTPTARGATALADFIANKRLVLPRSLGRALAGAGNGSGLTATTLGEWQGTENTTLLGANLPAGTPFNTSGTSGSTPVSAGSGFNVPANVAQIYTNGSSTPFSIIQPTTYFNVFIKL
jgi:hypothetical protein